MSKERKSNVGTLLEFPRTFMFRNLYLGISLIFFFSFFPGAIELLGHWFSITKFIPDKQKCITLWQGIISNFPLNWNSHFSCQKNLFLSKKIYLQQQIKMWRIHTELSKKRELDYLKGNCMLLYYWNIPQTKCFLGNPPDTFTNLLVHKYEYNM